MSPTRFEKYLKDFELLDEITRLSRIYGVAYDKQVTFKQFKTLTSVHMYLCSKEDKQWTEKNSSKHLS